MSVIMYVDSHGPSHSLLRSTFPSLTIKSVYSPEYSLEVLQANPPDLIITEIDFYGFDGYVLLERMIRCPEHVPVVVLSSLSSPYNVVRALRTGAEYFFPKPFDPDRFRSYIHKLLTCIHHSRLSVAPLQPGTDPLEAFAGRSRALEKLKYTLRLYAEAAAPVLITGESGSGKELAARTLHTLSPRRNGPFRSVHCGAIPASLLEAELYGSEPGAFTGATRRPGLFEQADGGTLFLDEIGEMSAQGQMKLLRIIEARQITRIGGRRDITIDVRIVCATNRDLQQLVNEGLFRADLYFRIHTLPIALPPLRTRIEDIPELALQYLRSQPYQRPQSAPDACSTAPDPPISYSALIKLAQYDWPGNVRELRNTLQLAQVLARGGTIKAEHIRVAY
ncbi:MAG: sigma-54-dependent transcriptional regulator [bacterium]